MRVLRPSVALFALTLASAAAAQDALRGAQLYLRLPAALPSCVSCHGPDPTQGRNNILRAADNPSALQKALNGVGAMGYLKAAIDDVQAADLAAYLGRVVAMANPQGPVGVWPPTLEFGSLSLGSVSAEHRVILENRGTSAWAMTPPQVAAGPFAVVHDCPASLAAGARCEARVRADPAATGPSTGVLAWRADAGWSPLLVGLVVEARAAGVAALVSQDPAPQIAFAATSVGAGRTVPWTFVSNGTEAFTLGSLNVTGPQAGEFGIGGDCAAGRSLPPGSTCTLEVTYRPAAPTAARAMLQLRGSGTHPAPLELAGQGEAAAPPSPPVPPATGGGLAGPGWQLLLLLAVRWLRRARPATGRRGSVIESSRRFHTR